MNPLNRGETKVQLICLWCCVAVNWLDHSRTFREQGVDENETLLLRRKFFYSDQNVDSRDPVQLNLLYVQVPHLMLRHWGWWESRKPLLWLVLSRSRALASVMCFQGMQFPGALLLGSSHVFGRGVGWCLTWAAGRSAEDLSLASWIGTWWPVLPLSA